MVSGSILQERERGGGEREGRGRERGEGGEREERVSERKTDREQRQNSELYYTKIKILFTCLFLQSVPANPHASRLHIKQ